MNADTQNITGKKGLLSNKPLLWLVFGIYIIVAVYAMLHHELWGDELHSWNIAKGSNSFGELISNRRYEGHPPFWYIVLWFISRFTHDPIYMQWIHLVIAITVVFLVLFYAPFTTISKIIIPFGYYFIFEYALLSRNYALGVLAGFLICIIINKEFKCKLLLYYVLLLIMSYTHLLATLLACSLQVYLLATLLAHNKKRQLLLHCFLGGLVFLSAIYFIKPPADSDLALASWTDGWNINRLMIAIQSPLRAFMPIPAWWKYNFWNQQCLIDLHGQYKVFKLISPLIALGLTIVGAYTLKGDKRSLLLFAVNTGLIFLVGNIYPLTTQRYTGFIFIGFLLACWLHYSRVPLAKNKKVIFIVLLVVQAIAGIFTVSKDIRLPFSNEYRLKQLLVNVPAGNKIVTDYWALIGAYGYMDKPYYCIDLEKECTFLLWGKDMVAMRKKTNRYYSGVHNLFRDQGLHQVYMFSTSAPDILLGIDKKLFTAYQVVVVAKMEGAIEKWSNLYLYQIRVR